MRHFSTHPARRLLILLTLVVGSLAIACAPDDTPLAVHILTADGEVNGVLERYIERGIKHAEQNQALAVVIRIDTPGGSINSMKRIVGHIEAAEVPVITWVGPPGAQAASAGTFITAAANFAVMAPATNIGAASPISSSGEDLPETLARKVNEDTKAFIRGIAEERDRNAEALQDTVTRALAYSASEAVELGVVDLIATDITDLLNQLDGRTAQTAAGPVVLSTAGLPLRQIEKTLLESFLTVIADPNIAFLLLSLGSLALMAEFFSPGVFGPGIVGVLALLLAFVALGQLPVNWAAVALILFSFGLVYFEFQAPGISVFGAGGLITFLVGAFLLFGGFFDSSGIPEPTVEVNRWLIGAMTLAVAAVLLSIVALMREGGSADGYVTTSDVALVGETGVALTDLAPSGRVRIGDREWTATIEEGERVSQGGDVRVVAVYSGDVLKVSAVPSQSELDS